MHGLAKGRYVSSVLCTVGPAKHLASATLGFTHRTSHRELGDGKLGVVSVFVLIKDVKLKFLLDTGAFHNFLSLHDAKSLGLPV